MRYSKTEHACRCSKTSKSALERGLFVLLCARSRVESLRCGARGDHGRRTLPGNTIYGATKSLKVNSQLTSLQALGIIDDLDVVDRIDPGRHRISLQARLSAA